MIEMEKRYKISKDNFLKIIKSKDFISKIKITQTYSNFNPDVRIREIQYEDMSTEYFHTVKYFLTKNQKEEVENLILKEQYDRIFNHLNKIPMIKNRYKIKLDNGLIAEIDEFLDTDNILVEVEFPNEEIMKSFVKPSWIGSEIKDKSMSKLVFSYINSKDIYEKLELERKIKQ